MAFLLSPEDGERVERLAMGVVAETLESYEAHRRVDGRRIQADRWKEVRRQQNVVVYKERSTCRAPFQTLRTLDGELAPVLCKMAPTLLAIGTLQGSLDDEMYGCLVMSDDAARARSAYLGDNVDKFRMLARVREPSEREPFRSCGICYCAMDSPYPLVKARDYCLVMATGMMKSKANERVGYYIIHSVDLWPTDEEGRNASANRVHAKGSICWLKIEQANGKVDLYTKGFFAPMGSAPEFASLAPLIEAVLTTAMTSDASYSKKLMWLIRDAISASRQLGDLPPMGRHCVGNCRTAFGAPKSSSSFRRCIVCKLAVCSSCEIVRKIAVDVEEESRAHQNRCSVCVVCMTKAKNAPAGKFALREARHAAARALKGSVSLTSSASSGSRFLRSLDDDRTSHSGVRLTDDRSDTSSVTRGY